MDQHGPDVPEVERSIPRFDDSERERVFAMCRKPAQGLYPHPDELEYVPPPQRKYLPTFAELVDRLTIVQLKQVFIPEHAAEYAAEIALIEHDIDLLLQERRITGRQVRAIAVLMLTNRFIWENESKAREGGSEQDARLKLTHSVNGVRSTAKNILSEESGERLDYKVDTLAAGIPPEFGNWRIWDDGARG